MPMEAIYREHAQTVYRYLLARTGSPELAEELTQETFYQAVRSVNRFDGSCKVSTWLCAIAKNALRQYRRKHPQAAVLDESYPADDAVEQGCVEKASRMELLRHLHQLSEDTREVIYLRLFGDLSFREIGDILSRSENWARVTFYRGKEKLKKELEHDDE